MSKIFNKVTEDIYDKNNNILNIGDHVKWYPRNQEDYTHQGIIRKFIKTIDTSTNTESTFAFVTIVNNILGNMFTVPISNIEKI